MTQELSTRDAVHRTIWTANHPPLYYALVAVPLRMGSDTGHPLRGVLGARLVSVGLSALGLVALAYLTATMVLGAAVVFVVRGPSAARLAAVAASAGLAALTRASGLLVAGAGVAVLVAVWRADGGSAPRRLGRAVVWAGAVAAAVVAVAGWFYLRTSPSTAMSPGRRRCWTSSAVLPRPPWASCSPIPASGGYNSGACGT